MAKTQSLVSIDFRRLLSEEDISDLIQKAFGGGDDALGILTVSGVKGYEECWKVLLSLAPELANLPDSAKKECEDPDSSYSVGWSHGKEALADGKMDISKGSFYANPMFDVPYDLDADVIGLHPAHCRPNIWPSRHLPTLEPAFKSLGQLIIKVGMLLMDHCDRYMKSVMPMAHANRLKTVLESSCNHKARLLHYFPPEEQRTDDMPEGHDQVWCGWHTDHGSLTGLTSAMYFMDGAVIDNPDPDAGLYIHNRHGDAVKAVIPADHIAFQVGESMQVHSGGLLKATPHYVRAVSVKGSQKISRSAFAVFMQPNIMEPMEVPQGSSVSHVAVGQWKPGMLFGDFAEATIKKYYKVEVA